MQKTIFTDLDGTLLEKKTYSYKSALPALKKVKSKNIPLIICTSKTRTEIELFKKKIKNDHPFISENGGAIFIPKGYFDFKFKYNYKKGKYLVIEYGTQYKKIINSLSRIKKQGIKIKGFHDMSAKELAKDAGLKLNEAKLAKKRDYVEPLKVEDIKEEKKIISLVKKKKLNCVRGGRYLHVMGKNDKGKATKELMRLLKKKFKKITTIGLGDSKNDFPMLDVVNIPFLVQKDNKKYSSKKYKKAKGIGPKGWNKVVLGELR